MIKVDLNQTRYKFEELAKKTNKSLFLTRIQFHNIYFMLSNSVSGIF